MVRVRYNNWVLSYSYHSINCSSYWALWFYLYTTIVKSIHTYTLWIDKGSSRNIFTLKILLVFSLITIYIYILYINILIYIYTCLCKIYIERERKSTILIAFPMLKTYQLIYLGVMHFREGIVFWSCERPHLRTANPFFPSYTKISNNCLPSTTLFSSWNFFTSSFCSSIMETVMLHWPFTKFGLVTVCSVSWQFYYTYEYSKYCVD